MLACLSLGLLLASSSHMACRIAPSKPWAQHVTLMLHCRLQRRRCWFVWSWVHLASMISSLYGNAGVETLPANLVAALYPC